jgi:hypothetical protein
MNTRKIQGTDDGAVQRQQALDKMSPELKNLAQKIDETLNRATKGQVMIAYDVGQLMGLAVEKEAVFDANPEELIAQYTQVSGGSRTLYGYQKMAEIFRRDFVKQQLAEPMCNGRSLSVSHFVEVASVVSPEARSEMFALIRSQCISVADLRDQLAARGLRSSVKKGGVRKSKGPVSPGTRLHRLLNHAERLRKYADVCAPVFDRIDEMPPTEVNANLLKQVEAAQSSTAEVIKSSIACTRSSRRPGTASHTSWPRRPKTRPCRSRCDCYPLQTFASLAASPEPPGEAVGY